MPSFNFKCQRGLPFGPLFLYPCGRRYRQFHFRSNVSYKQGLHKNNVIIQGVTDYFQCLGQKHCNFPHYIFELEPVDRLRVTKIQCLFTHITMGMVLNRLSYLLMLSLNLKVKLLDKALKCSQMCQCNVQLSNHINRLYEERVDLTQSGANPQELGQLSQQTLVCILLFNLLLKQILHNYTSKKKTCNIYTKRYILQFASSFLIKEFIIL